jgi:ATP-dependent Lhr-like helicase
MLELFLVEDFCEPPDPHQMHLSTLVQQVLSCIAERGGMSAKAAFGLLCETGPFRTISSSEFASFLRSLASNDLIMQTGDGDLVLGVKGERLVDHYTFYAAFHTPEEYRLVAGDRQIGSMPISALIFEGMLLIFAGQRWRIARIEFESKTLTLEPAAGGNPPTFDGGGLSVHDRIREKMRDLYESADVPRYLNVGAQRLLKEGRDAYRELGLHEKQIVARGKYTYVFPWAGTKATNALTVWLARCGIETADDGILLVAEGVPPEFVRAAMAKLLASDLTDEGLVARVENVELEKYDVFLPEPLARANYARRAVDVAGARRVAAALHRS